MPHSETLMPHSETFIPHSDTFTPHSDTFIPHSDTFIPHSDAFIIPHSDTFSESRKMYSLIRMKNYITLIERPFWCNIWYHASLPLESLLLNSCL